MHVSAASSRVKVRYLDVRKIRNQRFQPTWNGHTPPTHILLIINASKRGVAYR